MISKRILLATLCVVALMVAAGAYGYALYSEISSLRSQVDSLKSEISSLRDEIDRMNSTHMNSTRTFVFEWPPEQQSIVNGTLRIELTFTWKKGENLSIIAKVNDDEYDAYGDFLEGPADRLALVFDWDGDGQLDGEPAEMCYVDNTTRAAYFRNGSIGVVMCFRVPSAFHTCVFETGVGYTFTASIPVPEHNDLVYVRYVDAARWMTPPLEHVYVCFHFGMPLEAS